MRFQKISKHAKVWLELIQPVDLTDNAVFVSVQSVEQSLYLSVRSVEANVCQDFTEVCGADLTWPLARDELKCLATVVVGPASKYLSYLFHVSLSLEDVVPHRAQLVAGLIVEELVDGEASDAVVVASVGHKLGVLTAEGQVRAAVLREANAALAAAVKLPEE